MMGALTQPLSANAADAPTPHWVWQHEQRKADQRSEMVTTFRVPRKIERAQVRVVFESCAGDVRVNGRNVLRLGPYEPVRRVDITKHVEVGRNVIEIIARSTDGPAAAALLCVVTYPDGSQQHIPTDRSWPIRQARNPRGPLKRVYSFGEVATEPFGYALTADDPNDSGGRIAISPFDDYTQWKQAINAEAGADPATFSALPGYEIELVKSATKDEGSWVSMVFDPKGRLIVAREDKGLLRMTLARGNAHGVHISQVETINDTLKECRGLAFVGNDLYVNANNSKGLYRLRDTKPNDGKDTYDEVKLLYASSGGVGHGRNDLAIGPDGYVYAIHGDSVDLPTTMKSRLSPARHFGIPKGREGFVYRFKPEDAGDVSKWELYAAGLRNPYGIAFNHRGDAFTYDAVAEFDMGSPWYRPTHVRQLVSGADYGWRAVTGKWPPYFADHADNPPTTFIVGKGSPTAVKFAPRAFGTLSLNTLFILDWAYGRILAVHCEPRGAGYACSAQTLLKGRPLNVTDLGFGPDGAMYFVTGGRRTKAALYRVRYVGPEVQQRQLTKQQVARREHADTKTALRRRLEAEHYKRDAPGKEVTLDLLDRDPWVVQAARIAIEHEGRTWWNEAYRELKARHPDLHVTQPDALLHCLLALRNQPVVGMAWFTIKGDRPPNLTDDQLRLTLRLLTFYLDGSESTIITDPEAHAEKRKGVIESIDRLFPHHAPQVNRDLALLLTKLNAPRVVQRTVALLRAADTPRDRLHYLFALRNVKEGWSADDRRAIYEALRVAERHVHGAGMPGFLKRIRDESVATLTDAEKEALGDLIRAKPQAAVVDGSGVPVRTEVVKKWTLDDFKDELAKIGPKRDLKNGRVMFDVAQCSRCHRAGVVDTGGVVGPDLASVGRRFDARALLESIVEPSKVVAEPYRNVVVETKDGDRYVGRVAPGGDYRSPKLRLVLNPLEPDAITEVIKKEITSHKAVPISPMPTGLLDTLTRDEVLDLLSYLSVGRARE